MDVAGRSYISITDGSQRVKFSSERGTIRRGNEMLFPAPFSSIPPPLTDDSYNG